MSEASTPAATIRVSVVYALVDRSWQRRFELPAGASVSEAITASGLREVVPDIDYASDRLAVFGKSVKEDTPLRDGDRVEILRPLLCDPKEVRRQMAERQREAKEAGAV